MRGRRGREWASGEAGAQVPMTRAGGVTLDLSPARFRVVRPGHCRPASSGVWTDLGDMIIPDRIHVISLRACGSNHEASMDFWCAPLAIGCRALQRNVGVVEPHCCCMLWMLGDVWSRSSFLKNQADIYYLPGGIIYCRRCTYAQSF